MEESKESALLLLPVKSAIQENEHECHGQVVCSQKSGHKARERRSRKFGAEPAESR